MKNTFYIDMDGVVVKWFKHRSVYDKEKLSSVIVSEIKNALGICEFRSTCRNEKDCAKWDECKYSEDRFYQDLPINEGGIELVNLGRRYRDELGWNLIFLSAVPSSNNVPWVFYDKVMWAVKNFPDIGVHFGPYSWEKKFHCKHPSDILVDDRFENCRDWELGGGKAFHVKGSNLSPILKSIQLDFESRVIFKNTQD